MSLEENKIIVRRMYEEILNEGNLALADEIIAPDAVSHDPAAPPGSLPGPEGLKRVVRMLQSAFPDHHTTIEEIIAEGDKVVMRGTLSGTHKGDFLGIPPTGKHFTMTQIHIVHLVDGKVTDHWVNRDDLGMMQQLGVIAAPQQKHL